MKHRNHFLKSLLLLFFSIAFLNGFSQTTLPKKVDKIYQKAVKELQASNYVGAIQLFESVFAQAPDHQNTMLSLADLYFHEGMDDKALDMYNRIKVANIPGYYKAYLNSGVLLMRKEMYDSALIDFKKLLTYKNISYTAHEDGKQYVIDCEFAINAMKNPVSVSITNPGTGINSAAYENRGCPDATGNTMLFVRKDTKDENIFIAEKKDGVWQNAVPLGPEINTSANEGGSCIAPNGKAIYFVSCDRTDGKGSCDIYFSEKTPFGTYSVPVNLGSPINSPWWESQPSISADGKVIYFLSNRPGGYGGWDIWMARLDSAGKQEVINLGPNINTRYDESSPFIHPDGVTLYFASAGHFGMGNKDLFLSRFENGKWSRPQNLGYPLNNWRDQGGIWVSTDGKTSYISMDSEKAIGKTDIFEVTVPEINRPLPTTYMEVVVLDAVTRQPIRANVFLTDQKSGRTYLSGMIDFRAGKEVVCIPTSRELTFDVVANGYLFYSSHVTVSGKIDQNYPYTIYLEPIKAGQNAVLSNVYFKTNSDSILPESAAELETLAKFLIANPNLKIEIQGHTDNTGKKEFNQTLSEKRAIAVYVYLRKLGIDFKQAEPKGLGSSQPVAPNDTEENRQKNRRTQIRVTSY